jgi:hypothetical protein
MTAMFVVDFGGCCGRPQSARPYSPPPEDNGALEPIRDLWRSNPRLGFVGERENHHCEVHNRYQQGAKDGDYHLASAH